MVTTLFAHGRVHTEAGAPTTALLVEGARVAWTGSDAAAEALSPDVTVDLEGCWVAPAFVDAHVHTTSTGLALTGLDLTGTTSLAQALRLLAEHCRRLRGGVVLGTGWDETGWPEARPPTSAELDRASYGGVVYLARADVHSAVASNALLAACPEARGLPGFLPAGLVRQEAHHAVRRTALAAVTGAQRTQAQRAALDRAASLGIACVHECGGPDISGENDFTALLNLEHGVERIGYWGELGAVDKARSLGAVGAAGDLFVDGALGSHTACLSSSYLDADSRGHSYLEAGQISEHVIACTRGGLQAGFHAIGDAALQEVADGLVLAQAVVGLAALRAARHRVEHVEMVSAAQIATLAAAGVLASIQPAFDARWGGEEGMYEQRLGRDRALAMNPFAQMAEAGVVLALGSDSPVTPLDPWGALRAATRHRTPGSGLSMHDAFSAHTQGGWLAAGRQPDEGLAPGAAATFAVWQAEDPEALFSDADGPDPQCRRLVIGGRTVLEA